MDGIYKTKCLALVLAISKALEQIEQRNYGAAEDLLRDAWDKAAHGETAGSPNCPPQPLILR